MCTPSSYPPPLRGLIEMASSKSLASSPSMVKIVSPRRSSRPRLSASVGSRGSAVTSFCTSFGNTVRQRNECSTCISSESVSRYGAGPWAIGPNAPGRDATRSSERTESSSGNASRSSGSSLSSDQPLSSLRADLSASPFPPPPRARRRSSKLLNFFSSLNAPLGRQSTRRAELWDLEACQALALEQVELQERIVGAGGAGGPTPEGVVAGRQAVGGKTALGVEGGVDGEERHVLAQVVGDPRQLRQAFREVLALDPALHRSRVDESEEDGITTRRDSQMDGRARHPGSLSTDVVAAGAPVSDDDVVARRRVETDEAHDPRLVGARDDLGS